MLQLQKLEVRGFKKHRPAAARVVAEISEEPLRDYFGADGGGESLVQAYERNAGLINALAIEHHVACCGRPVLLESSDFELLEL